MVVTPMTTNMRDAIEVRSRKTAAGNMMDSQQETNDWNSAFREESSGQREERPEVPRPPFASFNDDTGDMRSMIDGLEIGRMAVWLTEKWPELAPLKNITIRGLWLLDGGKQRGDLTLAGIRIHSPYEKFWAKSDVSLWLAWNHLAQFDLTQDQIEALVFRQLCKIGVNDNGKLEKRYPDIEAFGNELKRYGAWTSSLQDAKTEFTQAILPIDLLPYGAGV